ncbi:GlxA family transcriptional regulator [uncultured Castellaniella sp.]|mgnify:CR=1 FL=1|uniref:GlxA family transcriptional regulator n=1 Tax=uncultured Castellaniella sp. TaxID=647907 RepID=UPI002638B1C6|nr:GlxA family transcriptional regulator [uncultured Castellaniella sp.]
MTPVEFGFLLIPQFSMLSFSGVLEPLRMANRLVETPLYRWRMFTPENRAAPASNGLLFEPTGRMEAPGALDTLIVVAGIDANTYCTPDILGWLRRLAGGGVNLGATSVGPLFLARAGLLDNHRCTIHWENVAGLREEFPLLNITDELYEIDGQRLTCSGGTAGLDMMMHLIGQRHGYRLATAVAEQCIHPEIRKSQASQRLSLRNRLNVNNPHLLAAIECMELHLEDTLSGAQLASQVGLSVRQLNRLFRSNLSVPPGDFYMNLRLERARALLEQTSMPVAEVSLACGFARTSHFIRRFRERFGHTPVAARRHQRGRYVETPETVRT